MCLGHSKEADSCLLATKEKEIILKFVDVQKQSGGYDCGLFTPPLSLPDRTLRGPDTHILPVSGQFTATLKRGNQDFQEKVYVVKGLNKPLLGRPAIEGLSLVQCVAALSEKEPSLVEQFPRLFQGLGKLQGAYTIKLQEGAQPYAISTPRRVAIPTTKFGQARGPVHGRAWSDRKGERTYRLPKSNGKVRICVDLTRLNQSVRRERHLMPAVDQTLAQLAGAKVFTKQDANSGFWQIPLSPESAPLTTFMTPFGRFCFHRLPFFKRSQSIASQDGQTNAQRMQG